MKIAVAILLCTNIIAVHAKDSATSLIESKILGGQSVNDTMQEKYSYVVFIIIKYEDEGRTYVKICAGSLISPLHTLSTAHCALSGRKTKYVNVDGITIRVGSNYRTKGLESDLAALYLPGGYGFGDHLDPNDIAVMLLRKPVCFTKNVSKIDLLEMEPVHNAEADALGWGKVTVYAEEDLLNSEEPLKIVKLMTITRTKCKSVLVDLKNDITKKHICMKEIEEDENIYQGDSGGPLVQGGKLIGVSTSGSFLHRRKISIFVGVLHHSNFIKSAMNYKTTDTCSSATKYGEQKYVGSSKLQVAMRRNTRKADEVVQYISTRSLGLSESHKK